MNELMTDDEKKMEPEEFCQSLVDKVYLLQFDGIGYFSKLGVKISTH